MHVLYSRDLTSKGFFFFFDTRVQRLICNDRRFSQVP